MTVLGKIETERWRMVAADIDGIPQPALVNIITQVRRVYLAWRTEARAQTDAWESEGYKVTVSSAAVSYFGPTDSTGNCWCVTGEKEISE